MSIEGAGAAGAVKITLIAPPLGGAALAWFLTEIFGANITFASLIAALIGVVGFYATNWGKDHLTDDARIVIALFVFSLYGALVGANATYELMHYWQVKIPKSIIVFNALLYGFMFQTILKRLQVWVNTASFTRAGFSFGRKPEESRPFGSEPRGTSEPADESDVPFGSKPRSDRYDNSNR
jgi:hypothetical protein